MDEMDHLRAEIFFDSWQPGPNDFHFLFKARIINPVVKASSFESIAQLAGAIRRENDIRSMLRLNRSQLRDTDLKLGKQLEQKSLERLVRPINFIHEQDR